MEYSTSIWIRSNSCATKYTMSICELPHIGLVYKLIIKVLYIKTRTIPYSYIKHICNTEYVWTRRNVCKSCKPRWFRCNNYLIKLNELRNFIELNSDSLHKILNFWCISAYKIFFAKNNLHFVQHVSNNI